MMKPLLMLILGLILMPQGHAGEPKICAKKHIPRAQAWIEEQPNSYDKFKHCAVSCYLRLRCSNFEVKTVGILKEIKDMFGPGNAEWADLKADFYGVKLARKKLALEDHECADLCDESYPKP